MSIVQMVKPGLRETRTSQLPELGCESRCLSVGLNHTRTKISPQETGGSAAEGAQGEVVMSFCTLTFNSGLWFPENTVGGKQTPGCQSYCLGAIFGDFCDQLLQRRHFKSLFEEILVTCMNVHNELCPGQGMDFPLMFS